MRNTASWTVVPCLFAITWLAGCGGGSMGGGPFAVSPAQAALAASTQTQQFTATGGGSSASWSVDGVAGGNTSAGTISSSGLYTPPATAGTHTIVATSGSKTVSAKVAVTDLAGVLTYHNDVARDGANTQELALAPAALTTANFGKRFSCAVDGAAYTQPLWVPGVSIGGAVHNVIFVATQHDSAYAFDADASPCVMLWHVDLLDTAHGGVAGDAPVPTRDVGNGFLDIQPEIGVTGSPVIDASTSTLYVVSKSEDLANAFHQRLHALDLTTGNEKFTGPKTIAASVPGMGDSNCPSTGTISFNPKTQHQRPALALSNGVVYVGWASHEDALPYHGWLIGYNAGTLARVSVFNSSPNGCLSGIWMAGGAPAFDSTGDLYLSTGNGTFDANSGSAPNNDFGNSALRLSSSLTLADWFTPFNQFDLNNSDLDLGSSGVVVLPDQTSPPTHLLLVAGKQGHVYLLDRDNMGRFCSLCTPTTQDTNTVQNFAASMIWGTPAFWQNRMFYGGTGDHLTAYDFTAGRFATSPSSVSSTTFQFPGPSPSVSSQGASGGVVWVIDAGAYGIPTTPPAGPAVLHAYDATNLATELWNSSQAAASRDQAGNAVKFSVPTVANGKVYIGTRTEIDVYGLVP